MIRLVYRFLWWLDDVLPVVCAACGRLTNKRKAKQVTHRAAGSVWLCPSCHREHYRPFDDGGNAASG